MRATSSSLPNGTGQPAQCSTASIFIKRNNAGCALIKMLDKRRLDLNDPTGLRFLFYPPWLRPSDTGS